MILCAWLFMALVMAVLWLVQRRTGDAGIVDVAWGIGVGLCAVFFAIGSHQGDATRRVLVAAVAMVWALRLSGYVLVRVLTMPEDGRYQTLKSKWGDSAQARMFRFYQFQALASVLFALPMLVAAQATAPLGVCDWIGLALWIVAMLGETTADRQLARFRADPGNGGRVCRAGLWRYSRHPNYFFEWLHWWAYVGFASAARWGWTTLLAPLAMYYFITRVTGIPPTEAQAIKTRGDAYREYQQTTSSFFLWPPKRDGSPV